MPIGERLLKYINGNEGWEWSGVAKEEFLPQLPGNCCLNGTNPNNRAASAPTPL